MMKKKSLKYVINERGNDYFFTNIFLRPTTLFLYYVTRSVSFLLFLIEITSLLAPNEWLFFFISLKRFFYTIHFFYICCNEILTVQKIHIKTNEIPYQIFVPRQFQEMARLALNDSIVHNLKQ